MRTTNPRNIMKKMKSPIQEYTARVKLSSEIPLFFDIELSKRSVRKVMEKENNPDRINKL